MARISAGLPAITKPKSGLHYRWLADDNDRLGSHLIPEGSRPGYRIVCGKNYEETKKLAVSLGLPDIMVNKLSNRITFGRLILGAIPKAEHAKRQDDLKADLYDRLSATKDDFMEKTTKRGIRPIIKEAAEFVDRKAHAERDSDNTVSLAGIDVPPQSPAAESAG